MKSLHLAKPRASMMVGVPGSGKSFFAEQFSETFMTPYIDSADIERLGKDHASSARLIAHILTEISKTQQTFILEGNADTKALRADFAKFAKDHGYDPLFIWVQADRTTSRQRSARKGLSQTAYLTALQRFEPPTENEKAIVISGRHTYASQVRLVLSFIGQESRAAAPVAHERLASPIVPARRTTR